MKDIGEPSGILEPTSPKPKWYPNVTVDAEDFPALVEKRMGKECIANVRLVKTGERINKGADGKTTHKIDLELRGMEVQKKTPGNIREAGRMAIEEYER
jgi:hypothetical protein